MILSKFAINLMRSLNILGFLDFFLLAAQCAAGKTAGSILRWLIVSIFPILDFPMFLGGYTAINSLAVTF